MIFKYNLNKPPTAHFHSMAGSMQRYGQIMPILVVAATAPRHTLIDGYLRVAAARRLGHDTLLSYIWHGYEKHALCHILVKDDQRRWDIFEQAGQLLNRHQLSQRELSRLLSISSNTVRRVSNWKTGYMQQNCHCIEALTSHNLSAKKEGLALCPFFYYWTLITRISQINVKILKMGKS